MRKRTAGGNWVVNLFYASAFVLYIIPFIACASSKICDPTIDHNYLSISHVIRRSYWNTSFAFLSAIFIVTAAHLQYSNTKGVSRVFVVLGALATSLPAAIPVDNSPHWSATDIVHTIGAVGSALFQFAFTISLFWCRHLEEYRPALWVAVGIFVSAFILLGIGTGFRVTETHSTVFSASGFFVSEYLFTVAFFATIRLLVVSRPST